MWSFNPEITIGNILTIVAIVFGVVGGWFGLKQIVFLLNYRVKVIEDAILVIKENIEAVEQEIKGIAVVVTAQAVQHTRIDHLQAQIEELKHGEGYVLSLQHSPYEVPKRKP